MPLYYHPPSVPVEQPVIHGQPIPRPLFYHAAPHCVDPSPHAQIPAGAPTVPLPFGSPHLGPLPPPGLPTGGFWSLTGFFPIARDAVPLVPAPPVVESISVVHPARQLSERYHDPAEGRGMIRSHTHSGNLSIHITNTCSHCGHSFPQDYSSEDVCRPCRHERRKARVRREVVVEELAALRAAEREKAETIARLHTDENRRQMDAKAKADAAEHDALRKLAEETTRQQAEIDAARKRVEEEVARQLAQQQKRLAEEEVARQLAEQQRKLAEEAARNLAAEKHAEELAVYKRAGEEARKRAAEAQERERRHIYKQYLVAQKVELDRLKSESAAKVLAEEEHRKRIQSELARLQIEEQSRKKAEEDISRQVSFALAGQARLQEQARIDKEYRDHLAKEQEEREAARLVAEKSHTEFLAGQAQQALELSHREADKLVREYFERTEEEKERALVREEVRRELAHIGPSSLGDDELLRRLTALKTDDHPPAPPPHKTTSKVNLEWEIGCDGGRS